MQIIIHNYIYVIAILVVYLHVFSLGKFSNSFAPPLYNQVVNYVQIQMWTCSCIYCCSTAPADYISVSSEPLTFTRGSPSDSVTISIQDDTTVEYSESFVARLSVDTALYPGVRLAPNAANVNIRDNDGEKMQPRLYTIHFSTTNVQCLYVGGVYFFWIRYHKSATYTVCAITFPST